MRGTPENAATPHARREPVALRRLSAAARRAIRQRVALAIEMSIHSVAAAGSVWTIRHNEPRPIKLPKAKGIRAARVPQASAKRQSPKRKTSSAARSGPWPTALAAHALTRFASPLLSNSGAGRSSRRCHHHSRRPQRRHCRCRQRCRRRRSRRRLRRSRHPRRRSCSRESAPRLPSRGVFAVRLSKQLISDRGRS